MATLVKPEKRTAARSRNLVLEEFTPYRIVALGHALSGRLAKTYADENLTIPEWRVLAVVAQAESVAARDVVARTPMDKMTVSRAVANLEEKSIVCRAPSETDRRVSMLSLSADGRALFDRVAEKALEYEDELMAALALKERRALDAALSKLMAKTKT
ncbi:MAG: MarR family transcriptional regulator [Marinicaulis sp.]|nr:MarR family transcriptional regulator [Marinicaulis sp.]NNL88837.1 MarR family transcriptional regulator [Marinicaulis sp.]